MQAKKPYHRPEIVVLGNVKNVTLDGSGVTGGNGNVNFNNGD